MLSDPKIRFAQEIARTLANEGMIFGQALEQYVKAEEFNNFIKFKTEEERDEFIDYILSYVETIWKKIIVIHDDNNNTQKMFVTINDAAKFLEVSPKYISVSKCNKSKIKKRYSINSYTPKIADLYEGIDAIRTRWNI